MRLKAQFKKRTVVAVTTAALVFGVGAGLANAALNSGHHKKTHKTVQVTAKVSTHPTGAGFGLNAVANYLGLTTRELVTQLQSGKSLAQIATDQGKSVSGLEDTILAAAKTKLDAVVSAGKMTADQESKILSNLNANIGDFVNQAGHTPPSTLAGPGGHSPFGGSGISVVTDYLGITPADLRTQIASGKSLAQIATDQGKSVSGLEDAILATAKANLDAAVAAGKLTAAQESTILSGLKAHIADFVNGNRAPAGIGGGPGGPPFAP